MNGVTRRYRDGSQGRRDASVANLSWFKVAAASSRMWRPGDVIRPGDVVGIAPDGLLMHATRAGRVRAIQYDVETDEVILAIGPIAIGEGPTTSG